MADQNQNIQVQMDLGDTLSKLRELTVDLQGTGIAVQTLAVRAATLGKDGEVSRVFLQGVTSDMRQVNVTAQSLDGQLKPLRVTFRDTGAAAKQLAKDAAEAAQKQRDAAAQVASADLRRLFPTPNTSDTQKLAAYEATLARITAQVARGKISQSDLTNIGGAVANNAPLQGLTGPAAQAQKQLADFQAQLARTNAAPISSLSTAWERFTNLVQRFVLRRVLFTLFGDLRQGVTDFIQIQEKLGQVAIAAQNTGLSFGNLEGIVRTLSSNTGFQQLDVAGAALQIFQQRAVSGADAILLLNQATVLARASAQTLQQATQGLVEVLNAYSISGNRAAEVTGILFRTSELAHAPVQAVGNDLARLGGTAQAIGIDLDQVAGLLTTFTQRGLSAGNATTILESLLRQLERPSREFQRIMEEWGTRTGPVAIAAFGGVGGVLQRLINQFNGDFARLEEIIPGISRLAGAFDGSAQSAERLTRNINDIATSSQRAQDAAARMAGNIGTQLQTTAVRFRNSITEFVGNITQGLNVIAGAFESAIERILGTSQTALQRTQANANAAAVRLAEELASAEGGNRGLRDNLTGARNELEALLSNVNAGLHESLRLGAQDIQHNAENLRAVGKGIQDDFAINLQRITKEVSEARRQIEASQRSLQTRPEQDRQRAFQTSLGFETQPQRALDLINRQIRETESRITALRGRTDEAARAEITSLLTFLDRLTEEKFTRTVEIARERARTFGEGVTPVFNPNTQQFEQLVNLSRQEAQHRRDVAALAELRNRLDRENIAAQTQRRDQEEARANALRERAAALERALTQLREFRVTNDQGELLPQFRTANPQEGLQRAQQEFERRIQILRNAATPEEFARFQREFQFETAVQAQIALVRRQIQQELHQRELENISRQAEARRDALIRAQNDANQAITAAQGQVAPAAEEIQKTLQALGTVLGRNRTSGTSEQVDAIRREIQEASRLKDLLAQASSPEQVEHFTNLLNQSIGRIQTQITELLRQNPQALAGLQNAQGEQLTGQQGLDRLQQQANGLNQILRSVETARTQLQQVNRDIATATQQMGTAADRLRTFPEAMTRVGAAANTALDNLNGRMSTLAGNLERIVTAIGQLGVNPPQVPNIPVRTQPGAAPGAAATPFAEGGWVPGNGFGDSVPAMLTPGEFVVNKSDAARFAPIVEALNRGMPPDSGAASGFSSVTNVGDITVNVVGGKHSDQTARDIAYSIRREIRRGTISQDQLTN